MKRPDFTPQQLAKLNEIYGENKTRRADYSDSGAAAQATPEPEPSPEQRMLATPEAARLRERGYDDGETLDALTRQMMIPGKDVLSSLPDKRYKAPEIDPTVLPGDTPSYTTFNGDVLTKDDADMDRWTAWRREPENAEALFRMKTGKSSMQYEKELKENLRRELTGILERANGRIGETEKRAAEAVGSGFVGTLAKAQIYGMPKMSKGGKDADLAVMAKRILGQLDSKTMKDRDEGDKSSGLWRGIKNNLTAEDFLSAGYSSILENLLEAQTLDKAHKGGNLTDTEKDVLRLKQLESKVNDYLDLRGGKTRGATVGGFVGDSAPFMAQFGLTSGVTALPSVGRAVAGKLLKTGMNAGIKQGIAKGLAKSVGAVSRMGAEAGAMLPLQASPYNNFLERTAGQYHVGDDGAVTKFATPAFVRAYKGLADAYTDVFTEKTGEGFGVLFNSLVGKPVARLAKNMGVERYVRRIPRNEVLDGLRHRLAYNGPVGEFMEEMEGNLLAPLLTGEHERWREGFSGENVWNTLLTTTVMWGGFKTLEIPHMADYAVRSAKLHGAEKRALAGIQSPELKTAVFAAMQQPTLATQSKALSGIDWSAPGITGMDAARAVDYARFRTERTILDGATRGIAHAEKIDGIYNELQRFQYRGEDGRTPSGDIVTAQAQDGNTYPVLSGGLSSESLDDNLFVWDEQAQQARQISRTELQNVQHIPVNEFVAEQYRQQDEAQEAEQQAEQAQEDVSEGVEAGIAPELAQRIVMPETEQALLDETAEPASKTAGEPEQSHAPEVEQPGGIAGTQGAGAEPGPVAEQYTNEDGIVLADGRRGVVVARETDGYIVEFDGGTFEKVPYNRVTGRAGEQEAAPEAGQDREVAVGPETIIGNGMGSADSETAEAPPTPETEAGRTAQTISKGARFTNEDAEAFRAEFEERSQRSVVAAERVADSEYGASNKIVTHERYEELRQRMRAKLGQLNTGFDPEILAMGAEMAAFHVEAGARKFADFARRMIDELGDAVRPYLKSIYISARHLPGMEELADAMDSYDNVMSFDLDKLDNPTNNLQQPEANAERAKTLEAQATLPTEADKDISLQGYYDTTGATKKDESEYGNLRPEENFKKDLVRFSKRLARVLGWEHDTDKKGKTEYVLTNVAPAGGDGHFILWKPGTDYGVYVSVTVNHSGYVAGRGYTDDLQIEKRPYGDILWRITSREKKYIGYRNYYVPANVTVGKLAALVNKEIKKYIGDEKAGDFFNDHVIVASIPKTQGNESKQTDKQRVGRSGPLEDGRKPAEPAVANGGERTGGTGENHRKQSESRSRNGADDVTERVQSGRSAGVHDRPAESGISAGEPGGGGNKRTTDERDLRPVERNRRNHVIERGAVIAPRGDISKIKANVAAIRLAKTLTEEERAATPEEKTRLEKYTGWGGLSAVFKEAHPYYNELKEVLAEDEYDSARASTTTSFFTPPEVVSSVWDMVERLGFKGGAVLEPSAGIGHFFGLMPPDLSRKSDLSGVELDRVSGLILKALYPDADIRIEGYEQQRIANNSLDLVVTNVPFGNMKVYDKFDKDLSDRFDIHDYFIAKSVRKLKPGGIGLFITSTATLDRSKALRNWVVNDGNADFIGAVRLNSDTFRQSAGTETSADIIVIRKRDEAGPSPVAVQMQDAVVVREATYDWEVADKKGAKTTEKQTARMTVNQYFADHPEKMAGVMRFGFEGGNALHPAEQRCAAEDGIDQSEVLASFVEALPQNIYEKIPVKTASEQSLAGDGTKEGGLALIDGKPCIIQYGKAIPAQWNPQKVKGRPKAEAVRDYLTLKETINKLIDAESNDAPDIETLRAYLNNVYDRFVRKYGTLSKNNRLLFLRDDVDFPGISAIEEVKEAPLGSNEKYRITKSDIFSRRVIGEQRELTAESLPDAIRISFYKNGRLDIPFIAGLLNKTEEETTREMLATEAAFINPTTGLVEDRDTYLSGNVRDKLMFAQQANESGEFDANIRELSKIVPLDLPLHLIKISLGSTWIPTKVYEKFFGDKFGVTGTITRLSSNKYVAKLRNEGNNTDSSMGMTEAPASRLALDCMNNTQTTIMQNVYDSESGKTKRVKDPTATAQASIKQTELGELFESWCKEDGNPFAEELVTIYNNTFNGIVEKKIDVSSFDFFPNATHLKKPRPHQKTGVLRGLSDAVLLANEVGTGKTITLISTAMEMRRLGIAKKPCIVVQRSTYNQFVNEIKALYPGAKVLVPSAKDLTAAQRQQLYSKIAYNDWDIVVLYHGYLDSIPDDPRRVNQYLDQLIDEKMEQMRELSDSNADGSKWQISRIKKEIENIEEKKISGEKSENVKQIEKAKANARARVSRLLDRRTDNTMTFEQLGIDALLVDEAHNYKKLGFNTSLQNIKGIDTAASQRAQSMRLKTSYILGNNQGKNVVFATGTPISNTMAEMWTWMRYLLPTSELERYEIADFDSFVRNFGTIEESAEFNAAGKFKVSNRFASYSNTPELLAIWKKIAYTVLTEDVPDLREGVGTPRLEGGKPSDLMLEQTPALKQVMKGIRAELARFENLTPKEKKEQSYIPLVMFGLAKRAAVDVRLVNPDLPDEPGSKTNIAVREVLADLKATDDYKGTIAIFCDSYQSSNKRFNLFEDIKGKLVGAGIPAEQIAIINDYATDEQKGRLFERVNTGDVRVVLGSTEKLGVGVNIQQRLHLLVQLDVPIRPMDYLQRLGRILRQGNMHLMMDKTVRILRLGVKQTLDVTGYQRLLIKDKFIRQVMKGDTSQRTIEEEDLESSDSTNFSQMMASLSGSQAALALSLEQNKLRKLTNQRDYHRQNQVYIADKLRYNRNVMATTEKQIEKMRQEKAEITSLFPEGKIVSVSVGNKTATAQEEIETLIDRTLTKVITKEADALRNDHKRDRSILKSEIKINDYLFDISVELKREYDIFSNKLRVFRSVSYACRDLSFIHGSAGANVENILKSVADRINPEEIDREIKQHEVGLEKAQRENESLEPQVGKVFPKQAELEATENKVAELQTQMEAELNEIEAQEEQEQVEAIDISSFIEEDIGDGTRFRDGAVGSSGINAAADRAKVEATAEATAVRLAGALHTPVEVVRDVKEITDADAGRQKRKRAAKGWYDTETGKAVLVLPNVESAADAEATVLHEAVGHMGLRAVLGERFGDFLDRVYMDEDGSLQRPIDEMVDEEQRKRVGDGQPPLSEVEARRIATEEYLAELAEGNITPGRFARIIGAVRRWFREVLGVPLRVNDRDIAYMLWLSRYRLSSVRSAGEAVARTASARRVRAALYGSEPVRYRIIMDDATPENIERYSVQEWLKTHHLPGVEFGEHWDDFARMVYDHATDLGRSAIHQLYGDVPLAATKRYLALRDLREVTDRAGYNHIIGELIKVLPRERRQEIVASQKKHLEFIFSDEYKSPLRRRTSKDEKPLPENFKYAAEYVEELLKKRKQQKAIAPAGEIEPTIIYDKHNKKHLLENILFDSTMPVRKLQEEITRRGGKIDDITNVYEHLNHYSSVTKVALQKYTEDYINPMLERISGLAKLTGADAEAVADYLSAESSLERDLSGVPALSPDPKSDWNREVAEAIIKAFRDVAGRKRVEAVERDGIGGIPAEERAELPAGLLEKVTRDGLASLDAAELSDLREAPVSAMWRAVNAVNDRVLDMLIEDGMMAQETRRLVKGHNWKYYVPLRSYDYSFRDKKGNIAKFDATELYDFIDARHTSGRLRQVVQEAEGRFTKPFNPVVQMVNIGIGAVISAKTNRMRQSALRLVQNTKGGGDLFRVNRAWMAKAVGNRWVMTTIDPSVEDIELSKEARKKIARLDKELQQAKKAHDEQGIAILESQIDEAERYNIVREYRATDDGGETFGREAGVSQTLQRQRCVECYVNGIKYIVTFADPAVSNAINGYHRLSIPQWVDNTVGNATRWLSRAFTSRNPAFVTVNFLRDVQHAALVHALDRGGDLRGFVRNVAPGMAAITRSVRGKARPLTVAELRGADMLTNEGRQRLIGLFGAARVYDTLYDYFRENGGETGFVHGKSVEEAERDVRRYVAFRTGTVVNLLQKTKKSERPAVALSYAARRSGATAVAEAFDRASRVAENTSRFATFVASLEQGKTMLRAVSDAKNVTVNFNRRGVATRALGMFYVFFNASMQGAAQVGRVAWRNRQRFAGAVAGMVSAGFLESLLLDFFLAGQGDDRDYISEYDRRNNLIIPLLGTRGFLKLPLPQGFRAFHGLGVLLHDAYVGKITAEECGRSMLGALYEDFSPVASPSSGGDLLRVVVPTAATPFYDIAVGRDAFGYPVGKRSFDDAPDYPLSEMGLRNVNRAILVFCRGLNALGGGDRDTPAGLRENGEIDPVLRGLFEWNPSHIEHVLTYYGGGMGKFAKDVVHTTQSLVDTDAEMNSYDLPIVNRLFGTAREENPASRYYALRERMNNLSAVQKRKGETDGPDAERVQLFREYDRIVRRIRKVLSGTNPGAAEYERLQEELNEAMKEYLTKDGQLYD